MKMRMFLVLCILFPIGCSNKISSNQIIGSWWYIQDDSTYSEVYINENEWVFNHESIGPISMKYYLRKDSLFISDFENINMKNWKVVKVNKFKLLLKRNEEEVYLYRLYLIDTYFDVLNDSVAYDNFEQEFIYRYLIRK